jgi:signal peptidase I
MTAAGERKDAARKQGWAKAVVDIAAIVLVVMVGKTAIAEPFYVPSGSMEPTLQIGDEILATKFNYGYSTASLPSFVVLPDSGRMFGALPERGDVVVFRWPGNRAQVWVKRVIGLPGDRIALDRGRLLINGKLVPSTREGTGSIEREDGVRIEAARFVETLPNGRKHSFFKEVASEPLDDMPEITVPPGHLFVMGDNRDNSADSRVPVHSGGVGLLPVSELVGKVETVVGSWDLATRHKPVWEWPSGLRLSRFFTAVQ